MSSNTVFVHISDTHAFDSRRDFEYGDGKETRMLLEGIAECEDPENTVVLHSGDLGWSMTISEYKNLLGLLQPLADFEVEISKGNHAGPKGLRMTPESSARWEEIYEEYCQDVPDDWPAVRVFNDEICIINCNSSWDDTSLARGRLGFGQIQLAQGYVRKANEHDLRTVVMLHHCPRSGKRRRRLSDREEFSEALGEVGVDVMLTGHLHERGSWSHVYGARYLFASPVSTEEMTYRRCWWEDDRLQWEWVEL